MHARQSVTSCLDTEPAGNSAKSNTSRACFAFAPLPAFALLEAEGFRAAFVATAFLLAAAGFLDSGFFDEGFFDAFAAGAFLPAALFGLDAPAAFAFSTGSAFFVAVFDLLLVAAIVAEDLADGDERGRRRLLLDVAERGVELRLDIAGGGAEVLEVEERRV